jgi:hypothetical protein
MLKHRICRRAAMLLFLSVSFHITALPSINDFLTADQQNTLSREGEITLFHFDDTEPQLIPETSHAPVLRKILEDLGGNFSIEGIFFIPGEGAKDKDGELLKIANTLSAVSHLQGLEYYSASRGEMRLLFEECYRIESPDKNIPLKDLHFDTLPDASSFYIHQKDLTFGSNRSSVDILSGRDDFFMSMKNTTNMKYSGLVRIIDKGNFHTGVLVVPVEEGILYYGEMTAKTLGLSFVVEKASKSFYNRMKALFSWFSEEYK